MHACMCAVAEKKERTDERTNHLLVCLSRLGIAALLWSVSTVVWCGVVCGVQDDIREGETAETALQRRIEEGKIGKGKTLRRWRDTEEKVIDNNVFSFSCGY